MIYISVILQNILCACQTQYVRIFRERNDVWDVGRAWSEWMVHTWFGMITLKL